MSDDGYTNCHWEHTGDRKDGNRYMSCCGQVPLGFKHHNISTLLEAFKQLANIEEYSNQVEDWNQEIMRRKYLVPERAFCLKERRVGNGDLICEFLMLNADWTTDKRFYNKPVVHHDPDE